MQGAEKNNPREVPFKNSERHLPIIIINGSSSSSIFALLVLLVSLVLYDYL